jgi:hypothetical protein
MLRPLRWFAVCAASLSFGAASASAAENSTDMVRFKLGRMSIEGLPLLWTKTDAAVLANDGRLWQFERSEITDFERTRESFRGQSLVKMRSDLQREFGSTCEVSAAGRYLVVHPRGQGGEWSQRFDELYRSFKMFFGVRGFQLREPEFPLVAVILGSKDDLYRFARREKTNLQPGILGYYSPRSNRVAMYDVTAGKSAAAWHANAETIIHEATHQTAFNTGVHSRFAQPPVWVAEGLGTLFEARGVWDPRSSGSQADKVNRDRLTQFRGFLAKHKTETLVQLVTNDKLFRTHADMAYAEAWALTYFLSQTRPGKYSEYLARTAQRPQFEKYSSTQRVADFTAVFGDNFRLLDAQFLEFMRGVE